MRIDLWTRRPLLANRTGGLSGPAIFPVAVRMVYEAYAATRLPIIGCGGVSSADDILAIRRLRRPNITAAIVGKALYDRRTTLPDLLRAASAPL